MKKKKLQTNATLVDSAVVYIYLHCLHILLEYILLYLLFDTFLTTYYTQIGMCVMR